MGLLDRFKKDAPGPDTLTREILARVRAVPGVHEAEIVDRDTVTAQWDTGPTTIALADLRQAWSDASGMDRIDLVDDFVAGLGPPVGGPAPDPGPADRPDDGLGVVDPIVSSDGAAPGTPAGEAGRTDAEPPAADAPTAAGVWAGVRTRLRPAVRRPGTGMPAATWPVAGVLEGVAVVDGSPFPVTTDDLASWGVAVDDVRAAAVSALGAPSLDRIDASMAAWVPTGPEGELAAWLCAPDALLAATGLTAAVALAPLPSELVLVDPDDHDALAGILASTEAIVDDQSDVLHPAPLLLDAAGAGPWTPPADHPCAERVRALGSR